MIPASGVDSGIECRTCGAHLAFAAGQLTTNCVYCGSPAVMERPPDPARPNPIFTIGFAIPREAALGLARTWQKRLGWFRHGGVKRARLEAMDAVYLPAYLYGAIARAHYRALIGEDYHEGSGKNRKRKTEYLALEGVHCSYVRDVVVTASRAIDNRELAAIEPFDLTGLVRFAPALVSGWHAEQPSRSADECVVLARGEAVEQVGRLLGHFMPGDRHKELTHRIELESERLELTLLPLWVLPIAFAPDRPIVRLLINGQTGKVTARVPLSPVRIGIAVALVLLLVVVAYWAGVQLGWFEGIDL